MHLRAFSLLFCVFSLFVAAIAPQSASAAGAGRYIVVLKDGASVSAAAHRHHATPDHVFSHALNGYSAALSSDALSRAKHDPNVLYVAVDRPIGVIENAVKGSSTSTTQPPQHVPTGVNRIDGTLSPTAAIDGVDNSVGAGVAVIDTGIDLSHPELRVSGGKNCSTGSSYADGNGHGTHVSGTIAALDNTKGVVGVAPGAPLYAVRVLNNAGSGTWSAVICGIDWVTAHSGTIRVANMSLGGAGSDDGNCGATNNDPLHAAICRSTAAGITYVVAAGNDSADAAKSVPSSYDEVITVSALADFNGAPGGGAAATCRSDVDDTLADFSNFGQDVDIAAPGVCIESTWKGGGYNTISGTSMATPHVTGAVALYRAAFPNASFADVKAALQNAATPGPIAGDTDGYPEGVLNVKSF